MEKLTSVLAMNEPPHGPSELMTTLISARQKVQLQFEDRLRLINAQIIFYKSSEQVFPPPPLLSPFNFVRLFH